MIFGDDRRAAAKPAERLAKRDVEIERQIPLRLVVRRNFFREGRPGEGVREFRRGRITRVTRPRHVIFFDQVQVDVQLAHKIYFSHRVAL